MGSIAENCLQTGRRIHHALEASGRGEEDVTIVAVTKTMGIPAIQKALAAGLAHFGENRVEEAEEKISELEEKACWHLIGPLQKKKARLAVALFDVIHSVESAELADRLAQHAESRGKRLDIFLQVNLSGDKRRYGMIPEDLPEVTQTVDAMESLHLRGLMTMPPYSPDLDRTRSIYRELRVLRDELHESQQLCSPLSDLSMGMTDDFEIAIAEGATVLRIGRALFGERRS